MPTYSPHNRAVIAWISTIRRTAIERISADAAHIVTRVPRPVGNHVPFLDLDFESHAMRGKQVPPVAEKICLRSLCTHTLTSGTILELLQPVQSVGLQPSIRRGSTGADTCR
jgi:hypothetical protein